MTNVSFAPAAVHELYEANITVARDALLPADWPARVDDAEIVAKHVKAEKAAAAQTKRQVGADAWRRYRDDRNQLGPPVGSGSAVVAPSGTVIHTISPLKRGAESVVRRAKASGRFQTIERP